MEIPETCNLKHGIADPTSDCYLDFLDTCFVLPINI